MFITIQLIFGIWMNVTHARLQVTYDIRNAKTGVKSYFNAVTKLTSNSYVGAKCKVRRHLVCEPLSFDWFSREEYKDNLVYLMKSCVVETFEENVTLVCLCVWLGAIVCSFSTLIGSYFDGKIKYSLSKFCDKVC